MSSVKSIVFLAAFSSVASALPRIFPGIGLHPTPQNPQLSFPKTGGQELTLTDTDLKQITLITLGRGIQNYTCPSGASAPVQTTANSGAVADLFDVTNDMMRGEQRFVDFFTQRGPSLKLLDAAFPKTCHHEFTETNVPKFDCGDKGIIFGKKVQNVAAPASASTSDDGHKAVDWLLLDAADGSMNFTKVIRVVTAGGSPPASCNGITPDKVISVDYAAQYWFFNDGSSSTADNAAAGAGVRLVNGTAPAGAGVRLVNGNSTAGPAVRLVNGEGPAGARISLLNATVSAA